MKAVLVQGEGAQPGGTMGLAAQLPVQLLSVQPRARKIRVVGADEVHSSGRSVFLKPRESRIWGCGILKGVVLGVESEKVEGSMLRECSRGSSEAVWGSPECLSPETTQSQLGTENILIRICRQDAIVLLIGESSLKTESSLNYINYKHYASFLGLEHSHHLWHEDGVKASWRVLGASGARDVPEN